MTQNVFDFEGVADRAACVRTSTVTRAGGRRPGHTLSAAWGPPTQRLPAPDMTPLALPTVMLMMLAQSALGLPMAATQQELEQFEIIDELVPSFGHRRAQTNSSSTTCDTPIPENGGLGKKGTKFYCPAKMQDGTDCMPACDEGFTLMISVRQDKIIPNKCREGVLKTKAVCEPVDKCFGPCISRETFENISTTGWVIIAVLAGACLGGCGFMCNRVRTTLSPVYRCHCHCQYARSDSGCRWVTSTK